MCSFDCVVRPTQSLLEGGVAARDALVSADLLVLWPRHSVHRGLHEQHNLALALAPVQIQERRCSTPADVERGPQPRAMREQPWPSIVVGSGVCPAISLCDRGPQHSAHGLDVTDMTFDRVGLAAVIRGSHGTDRRRQLLPGCPNPGRCSRLSVRADTAHSQPQLDQEILAGLAAVARDLLCRTQHCSREARVDVHPQPASRVLALRDLVVIIGVGGRGLGEQEIEARQRLLAVGGSEGHTPVGIVRAVAHETVRTPGLRRCVRQLVQSSLNLGKCIGARHWFGHDRVRGLRHGLASRLQMPLRGLSALLLGLSLHQSVPQRRLVAVYGLLQLPEASAHDVHLPCCLPDRRSARFALRCLA